MNMNNILTVDIGNSDIKTILYDDKKNELFRMRKKTIKDPELISEGIFLELKEKIGIKVDLIVLSCVVPAITKEIIHALNYAFNSEIINVTPEYSGFNLGLEESKELGADFIASGWGAMGNYNEPVIIIDMGTASKISVVDEPNKFLGGIIQPGLGTLISVINSSIPHLPKVPLEKPDSVIGYSTTTFLQSGIVYGAFESLLGLAKRMEKELGRECTIVFTGGYSNLYKEEPYIFDFDLVNAGLLEYGLRFKAGLIERSKTGFYNFINQRS